MTTTLVSRQAEQPSMAPAATTQAIAGVTGQLPEVLQLCNAIAGAGEMLPRAYQGKPGAVLLAKMWADRHDVDLFTAIQQISVIDGKPYVSAEMRVALATAAGFEFRVTESSREMCTIEVWDTNGIDPGGTRRGSVTCRFDDRERKLSTKSGAPTPWALHPDDMLFAEACRKADRRFVRTAAVMLDSGQDHDGAIDPDPVDIIGQETPQEPPGAPEPEPTDADVAEAPAGQDGAVTLAWDPVEAEAVLRQVAKATKARVGDVLKEAQTRWPDANPPLATIEAIAADQAKATAILDWLEGGE